VEKTYAELGIVLKTEQHKDSGVRCYILTPSGMKTAYAAGALGARAKLKSAIQLFTIAEFTFTGSRITGAHVIQLGFGLSRDINRYYLACSICNTLNQVAAHSDITNQLFYLTARTFEALDGTISAYKIFINFFTKLLCLLGYDIDIPDGDGKLSVLKAAVQSVDNTKIDDIKVDLTAARTFIRLICKSFEDCLDIKIINDYLL